MSFILGIPVSSIQRRENGADSKKGTSNNVQWGLGLELRCLERLRQKIKNIYKANKIYKARKYIIDIIDNRYSR